MSAGDLTGNAGFLPSLDAAANRHYGVPSWITDELRVHIGELNAATSEDDYRIHCAALEWSLAEPIIINSARDIKSVADWRDRVQPYRHQVENLMRFCRRLPVTLLADDVGLGKTISAGLILSELMSRGRVSRTFVVCPKILIPQWVEELQAKFGIEAYGGSGNEVARFHRRGEPVLVTTYQSATTLLERQDPNLFDMLILDEAHKVRNLFGGDKPPKMATAVYQSLQSRMFKYVLMLTATPIQNRLWDIYSLIECLAVAKGHRNPLGDPQAFTDRYLADGKNKARSLRPDSAEEFRSIVGNYMFRTRRVDAKLAFPDRLVKSYDVIPTNAELQLQGLIAANIDSFSPLLQASVLVALMSSPHALVSQLRNMAEKNSEYAHIAEASERLLKGADVPAKIAAVRRVVQLARSQRQDWRIVIFTTRKETQDMIGRVLSAEGVAVGYIRGAEAEKNRLAILGFRETVPKINVIISTDAGAEGVNLQAANVLINYDLPWNPMIVEQRIGRVQRIGSRFKSVWVANVVHADSAEQRIVARLMEKLQVISHTVGDIEAVLEASDDPNGESFEKQIRQMVIASLQGQDMDQVARKAEQSIAEAKALFDERQAEMDSKLGSMNDQESDDLPMPELAKRTPVIPLTKFVQDALTAEGATIEKETSDIFRAGYGGRREERFTFDRDVAENMHNSGAFMGRRPILYQPGKPAFERLVQRWLDRGSAWIVDQRVSVTVAREAAASWIAQLDGATMVNCELRGDNDSLSGEIVARARAANAVDSYEKLVHTDFRDVSGDSIAIQDPRQSAAIVACVKQRLIQKVVTDPDITAFQRYYTERLRIESAKSDGGDRLKKLQNDLSPRLFTEVVAIKGFLSGGGCVVVSYRLDNEAVYTAQLQLNEGYIVNVPACGTCSITGRYVPLDAMAQCQVTGTNAIRHKLRASAISGLLATPDTMVQCEETQRWLLPTEVGTCSLTGRTVGKDLLVISELSGRKALRTRSLKCHFSGCLILDDEIAVSDYSGHAFRRDEALALPRDGKTVHRSEACRCDETGEVLLADSVTRCSVTGKTVRRDLVAMCPETGHPVLRSLMEVCEETGDLCSPNGLIKCDVTGKKVRRSLLAVSATSGRMALKPLCVHCEVTKDVLLPDEVGRCELSGKTVNRKLLRKCSRSGVIASRDQLGRSVLSKLWFQPKFLVTMANGQLAANDEVATCFWRPGYLPKELTAECSLTGLTFSRKLLNASGEFKILRECLDGTRLGEPFSDPEFLARTKPDVFHGSRDVCWIQGPQGAIMHGRRTKLGIFHTFFGVMVQNEGHKLALKGRAVFGKRVAGFWQPSEQFEM